ncbi:hypothetical protein [Anaerosporobacter sp.]
MKKNFVKKSLASTLALAMVATAMPGAFTTASAAKAPAFNRTSKTIYINDNEIGSKFDFNISNKVKGSKYKWTTSNKAIATVNSKGLTKAGTKTGEATISCKITLPTKKTKTLKATVTVKENATKVWAKNAPENNTVGIGENVFDFNSSFSTASGAKATDYRMWEIDEASNTAGATIGKKDGVVSTTKAGEFKVRVRAYQNKTKLAANDTVDSEWMTIKVVPAVKSVAQTATTKVAVTFDDNMKDTVKAENFSIKNKATNVVSAVKGIEFSEDGKVVTVETYATYADGATYVLTYGDKEFDFTTSIGEVATIEVKTTTVVENKATEIEYVLRNANGVDITDAKKSSVTIEEVENKDGWYNTTDGKLTIFNKGSVAKLKVTYHTYKYDTAGKEEGAVSVEATITAIEETAATIGAYKNYVIADKAPNWDKVTENKNVIAVGEEKNLYLKALDSEKNDVTGLTFESGNDNILLVTTNGDHAVLKAVKEGSTVVVVKNEKGSVLWTLPVVIKAERKANTITLAKSSTTLVTGTDIATDTIEVKIKDQHGDDFAVVGNFSKPEAVKTYTNGPVVDIDATDANKISVDARTADAGTYQYKVALTSDANKLTVLTVVVKENPNTAVNSYKLDLSTNTVDTVVDEDTTETKSVAVKVVGYASGLPVEHSKATITVTGPNNYKETYQDNFSFDYVTVSNGTITKLAKGTYTITAEKDGKTIAKTAIVVSDSQVAPTVTLNKATYAGTVTGSVVLAAMQENSTVKNAAGKELKVADGVGIVAVDYTDNGSSVYVKTVTVKEQFGANYYEHTVTVGKTITIK